MIVLAALRSWYMTPYWRRISELSIINSGLSEDCMPFLDMKDGKRFFGLKPLKKEKFIYRYFIPKKI